MGKGLPAHDQSGGASRRPSRDQAGRQRLYFNTPEYDRPAYRNFVMCHELGHTLGLAHQNEDFDDPNPGTCMDFTNRPKSNQHPNRVDYRDLKAIYAEADSTTTVSAAPSERWTDRAPARSGLGRPRLRQRRRRTQTYVAELGDGRRVITIVTTLGNEGASVKPGLDDGADTSIEPRIGDGGGGQARRGSSDEICPSQPSNEEDRRGRGS